MPDLNRAKIAVRLRSVHFEMRLNIISNLLIISSSEVFNFKIDFGEQHRNKRCNSWVSIVCKIDFCAAEN